VSLLFRIGVFVPVLLMIAIVVCGQHHTTARATFHDAIGRTVRWLVWSAMLLAVMLLLEWFFIGF